VCSPTMSHATRWQSCWIARRQRSTRWSTRGVLPRPFYLLPNVVRWRRLDVDVAIQAINQSSVDDVFLARVKNADFKKAKKRD
jgi:hypothetical protein